MKYQEYHNIIKEQMELQFSQEGANIEKAAEYCAASVCSGRVIHCSIRSGDIANCESNGLYFSREKINASLYSPIRQEKWQAVAKYR